MTAPTFGLPRLGFVLLAGPLAWTVHLLAGYGLVALRCDIGLINVEVFGLPLMNLGVIALTTVLGAFTFNAGFVAYQEWRMAGSALEHPSASGFMGLVGLTLSILFFVTIILGGIPALMLAPCA